ncbi:hypothetical protein ABMA32_05115 [Mesorhizobium sp. VNQ89]|uniref:hypothetical protein n=1 Tax=Mesorhizobium quangtriensis TaxID=3157709 RepID=UPI0032B77709
MMRIAGREFSFVIGSDVDRDGMYYEVSESKAGSKTVVAEVFYSDKDRRMTFTAFLPDLPFEVIEHLAEQARDRLTPVQRKIQVVESTTKNDSN